MGLWDDYKDFCEFRKFQAQKEAEEAEEVEEVEEPADKEEVNTDDVKDIGNDIKEALGFAEMEKMQAEIDKLKAELKEAQSENLKQTRIKEPEDTDTALTWLKNILN